MSSNHLHSFISLIYGEKWRQDCYQSKTDLVVPNLRKTDLVQPNLLPDLLCICIEYLTEIHETNHPSGSLRHQRICVNGQAYGEWKHWYSNGTLAECGSYLNNEKNGEWKQWHDNGNIYLHSLYKNGNLFTQREIWKQDDRVLERTSIKRSYGWCIQSVIPSFEWEK